MRLRNLRYAAVLVAASLGCSSERSKAPDQAPITEPPRPAAGSSWGYRPSPNSAGQDAVVPDRDAATTPALPTRLAKEDIAPSTNEGPGQLQNEPLENLDYAGVLQRLGATVCGEIADVLEARVNQEKPKMKLSEEEARRIAVYILEDLQKMPNIDALLDEMPKAAVELVRAVHERDMSSETVEEIALYLSNVLERMRLGNVGRFDESVSHVIGRTYEQIDWSGENTSAEQQRGDWELYGVPDFRTAEHYHNYLRHAVGMRWFKRAFQPRGRLPESFEAVLHPPAQ